MSIPSSERRLSLAFIAASAIVFGVVLVLAPPFAVTFDEARYVGVGYSMVEGQGPQTVFGGYFLPHAPVWSTLVVAPAVALGIDPLVVGRFLNALSGVGLLLAERRPGVADPARRRRACGDRAPGDDVHPRADPDLAPGHPVGDAGHRLPRAGPRRGPAGLDPLFHRGRAALRRGLPRQGDRAAARPRADPRGRAPPAAVAPDPANRGLVDPGRDRRGGTLVHLRRAGDGPRLPPGNAGMDPRADRPRAGGGRRCRGAGGSARPADSGGGARRSTRGSRTAPGWWSASRSPGSSA